MPSITCGRAKVVATPLPLLLYICGGIVNHTFLETMNKPPLPGPLVWDISVEHDHPIEDRPSPADSPPECDFIWITP